MSSLSGDAVHHHHSFPALTSWIPSMTSKVVVGLGVVDILKTRRPNSYMSAAEIVVHLPNTNTNAEVGPMLDRLMRLLASYGALTWRMRATEEGHTETTYGLVEVAPAEYGEDMIGSCRAEVITEVWEKVLKECWYHMKDVVIEGGVPFNRAYGMNIFEYLSIDPIFNDAFNNTLSNFSSIVMNQLLQNYDGFKGISTLVDVGGGIGTNLHMIVSKYPLIKGINFDLPQVIKTAPYYPGVQHVSGDMFASVPEGDAIFLKWISHDWSDEHCVQVVKNIYDALPSNGKLIICEYILPLTPESNEARTVFHMDLTMLTLFPGGKERSKADFEYLAKACGFQGFKIASSAYHLTIMEFLKTV